MMDTIVCLASGPSLTEADILQCRPHVTIVINDTVFKAPWASVLIGGDPPWWRRHQGCAWFSGTRYTCSRTAAQEWPDVRFLQPTGLDGFEWEPGKIRTGGNSGYVAIQLAAQMGATRVILLGYDMQPAADGSHHHHAPHPHDTHPDYARCLRRFDTLVEPLATAGIEVVNASRRTAMRCFPCLPLSQALTRSKPSIKTN